MARVSFHLKRYSESTKQRVFALYHVNGKQVKIYTPFSVVPKDWNRLKQRVKAAGINAAAINDQLGEIARTIEKAAYELEREGDLNAERLKLALQAGATGRGVAKPTLLTTINEWIEQAETTHRELTIRNYETFKNHLEKFCTERHIKPTLAAVDKAFLEQFALYLTGKGMVNTTRWNLLKIFKAFLRWAYDNGHTSQRAYETVRKKAHHVIEPPVVRLQEQELHAIAKLDLSNEPALSNARDLFLLQCSVGVRFSDLEKISPANVEGDFVRIVTQKTSKEVAIPLLPTARRIIEQEKPPHPISNQKLNIYLKEIAKRAKLERPVSIPSFKGTTRESATYPLHELVTTHIAKRTFVSMMISRGVSVDTIMKITGNNRATIERYISIGDDDVQADLSKVTDLLQ